MAHPDDPKTGSDFRARWHRFISESYNRRSIMLVAAGIVLAALLWLIVVAGAEPDQNIPPAVKAAIDAHRNDPPPIGSPRRN